MNEEQFELWVNFLANEKLTASAVGDENVPALHKLVETLASLQRPKITPYQAKLESRQFVCVIAMYLGLDLTKLRMSRALLDAWNQVYAATYGSTVGTASEREAKRRDVVTRLRGQGIRPPRFRH